MHALSELFDETRLLLPEAPDINQSGEIPLTGHGLSVVPLTSPSGEGLIRKLSLLWWLAQNGPRLIREISIADVIHAPIPGDIGTLGMLIGFLLRKPLFVRYCGNWEVQRTMAEKFWRWFMETFAGGRNVMLATGGADDPPSRRNPEIEWVFSTSLTEAELIRCGRRRDRLPGTSPRLITVSRQEYSKGIGAIIESLPLLLFEFPGSRLFVLGEGCAVAEFRRLADRL
jgi:hypothetical protein